MNDSSSVDSVMTYLAFPNLFEDAMPVEERCFPSTGATNSGTAIHLGPPPLGPRIFQHQQTTGATRRRTPPSIQLRVKPRLSQSYSVTSRVVLPRSRNSYNEEDAEGPMTPTYYSSRDLCKSPTTTVI
mmetsp:Transcript_8189/g.11805  ORF Transcript_8189/g.11805 Transcript_8189/m.11805 type:complete len:128 (-) Transcript_8189:290-673(-)